MIKFLFLGSFFLLFGLACSRQDHVELSCNEILTDLDLFANGPQDGTMVINSVSLDESCLNISVSYSGGCEEHNIQLVTDGVVIYTNPPSRAFKLIHENTDPCEAYLTEEWEYDLNSLDNDSGFLEIILEGYDEKIIADIN